MDGSRIPTPELIDLPDFGGPVARLPKLIGLLAAESACENSERMVDIARLVRETADDVITAAICRKHYMLLRERVRDMK